MRKTLKYTLLFFLTGVGMAALVGAQPAAASVQKVVFADEFGYPT